MNIMKLAAIQLTNILKGMWATLMANPLLLVAGAVTGLDLHYIKLLLLKVKLKLLLVCIIKLLMSSRKSRMNIKTI